MRGDEDVAVHSRPVATAERVAALLRQRIVEGVLPSGTSLRETVLAREMGVSRNTLREALRLLVAQGLVAQQLYRGAVVGTLTTQQVHDLYTARRAVELHAIDESAMAPDTAFAAVRLAVDTAEQAVARRQWREAGTASLRFHQSVVGLLGAEVLDTFFAQVVAQLRLAFGNAMDGDSFQVAWVERDREIAELLETGRRAEARTAMGAYLDQSERWVLDVVHQTSRVPPRPPRTSRRTLTTIGGQR